MCAGIETAKARGISKGRPVTLEHAKIVELHKQGEVVLSRHLLIATRLRARNGSGGERLAGGRSLV